MRRPNSPEDGRFSIKQVGAQEPQRHTCPCLHFGFKPHNSDSIYIYIYKFFGPYTICNSFYPQHSNMLNPLSLCDLSRTRIIQMPPSQPCILVWNLETWLWTTSRHTSTILRCYKAPVPCLICEQHGSFGCQKRQETLPSILLKRVCGRTFWHFESMYVIHTRLKRC